MTRRHTWVIWKTNCFIFIKSVMLQKLIVSILTGSREQRNIAESKILFIRVPFLISQYVLLVLFESFHLINEGSLSA